VIQKTNLHHCEIVDVDSDVLYGRFLVYVGDMFETALFRHCVTDDYANIVAFSTIAQESGAIGVLTQTSSDEDKVHFSFFPFLLLTLTHSSLEEGIQLALWFL
jgi:hypothetical protein